MLSSLEQTRGGKERRVFLVAFVCFFLALMGLIPAAGAESAAARLSFRHVGVLNSGAKNVPVYEKAKTSAEKLGQLEPNEAYQVVGESGKFYRVVFQKKIGFVAKEKLKISGEVLKKNLPEVLKGKAALEDYIPILNSKYLTLTGTIKADRKIDTLYAYFWDERLYRVEQAFMKSLDTPSSSISTDSLKKFLPISNLKGGRKTLVIQGSADGDTVVLFRAPVYIRGAAEEPAHVTGLCSVSPASLTDKKVSTAWQPSKSKPSLTVDIPKKAQATLMTMEWKVPPKQVIVELQDGDGKVLSSETKSDGFYLDWVALSADVRRAVITPTGSNCALATLRVYAEPYSTHAVQQWQPIPDKIDLLVVATHQDDELLFMGGTIPAYTHQENVNVAVLYMADCGRTRYREALDGLWTAGLKYHPIFLGLEDFHTMSSGTANGKWKKFDPQAQLTAVIRRYRPEVIVCQDFNGEYGHGQHKLTAQLVADSVTSAAQADYDAASYDQYGAWQVKKLYVHLYEKNPIKMDWTQPLDDSGVITPLFLATEAYDKHRSQQGYFSMHRDGKKYDNTSFGLYFTTVGPDKNKNDFLENIR